MGGIFISYRRGDSAGYAGRLSDHLRDHFGRDRVFMDIEAIEVGADFVEAIEKAVSSCVVLIAMIGPSWSTITDSSGRRRLESVTDFTRVEISAALQRKIRVIPVLVQDAPMPREEDLPDDLKALTRRQALSISNERWDFDVNRLIEVLEKDLGLVPDAGAAQARAKAGATHSKSGAKADGEHGGRRFPPLLKGCLVAGAIALAIGSSYLATVLGQRKARHTAVVETPQQKQTPAGLPSAPVPRELPAQRSKPSPSPFPAPLIPPSKEGRPQEKPSTPTQKKPRRANDSQKVATPQAPQPNAPPSKAPPPTAPTAPTAPTKPAAPASPEPPRPAPPKPKLYTVNTSQDRGTIIIFGSDGTEGDHITLGADRVQKIFKAPNGKSALAVYKVRNQQQYGVVPVDLTQGKGLQAVDIPSMPEGVSFEGDEAVLSFPGGESRRIPLQ